jgi:hypothetical protein
VSADLIKRSNAIFISVDDMFRASDATKDLPSNETDWEGRMDCLMQIFRGRRDKAFVVNSRLDALSRLVTAGKLPYGVLPTRIDGLNLLADCIFVAAAKLPILFVDEEPYFEPEPFVAFVLRSAKASGDLTLRAVTTKRRIRYPIRPAPING